MPGKSVGDPAREYSKECECDSGGVWKTSPVSDFLERYNFDFNADATANCRYAETWKFEEILEKNGRPVTAISESRKETR